MYIKKRFTARRIIPSAAGDQFMNMWARLISVDLVTGDFYNDDLSIIS